MEKYGYKAFYPGLKTKYGTTMEVNKKYHVDGPLNFGYGHNRGNGLHFCERLEDTLRFFEAWNNEVEICLVKGSGQMIEWEDDYYGYYYMYACSDLEILKKLTREEIFKYAYQLEGNRLERFLKCYQLNKEELELLKKKLLYDKIDYNTKFVLEYYLHKKHQ